MIPLLLLLAWLLSAARAAYDPFTPAAPPFPAARLRRAGLDATTLDRLAEEYATMDAAEKRELTRFVSRNPDRRVAERFQGRRTREDLEHMTVDDDLIPLLRQRHLPTQGRKAELIDRLLESYDTPSGALSGNRVPDRPDTPGEAPQAGSSDDRAATAPPEPEAPATSRPAPAQPATPAAPSPAPPTQAPGPQTPDATPAPATTASADTTTQEAPRG